MICQLKQLNVLYFIEQQEREKENKVDSLAGVKCLPVLF